MKVWNTGLLRQERRTPVEEGLTEEREVLTRVNGWDTSDNTTEETRAGTEVDQCDWENGCLVSMDWENLEEYT